MEDGHLPVFNASLNYRAPPNDIQVFSKRSFYSINDEINCNKTFLSIFPLSFRGFSGPDAFYVARRTSNLVHVVAVDKIGLCLKALVTTSKNCSFVMKIKPITKFNLSFGGVNELKQTDTIFFPSYS